jgi:hypothetical protein
MNFYRHKPTGTTAIPRGPVDKGNEQPYAPNVDIKSTGKHRIIIKGIPELRRVDPLETSEDFGEIHVPIDTPVLNTMGFTIENQIALQGEAARMTKRAWNDERTPFRIIRLGIIGLASISAVLIIVAQFTN